MNDAVVIALIAAVPGLAGALFAYRQATKAAASANRSEVLKIEAEAFSRARRSLEIAIDELEGQVQRMREDQRILRDQLTTEERISVTLRARLAEAETTIGDMQRTITWMRAQLVKAGIDMLTMEDHV